MPPPTASTRRCASTAGGTPTTAPDGRLVVSTSANQDPVGVGAPLLGIDIWEHAFYLQYKNDKMAYLSAIWDVVNWTEVGARFDAATAGGK